MTQSEEKPTPPIPRSVVDGLGGTAHLVGRWTYLRDKLATYAKTRSADDLDAINRFLKAAALTLDQELQELLPQELFKDFWRVPDHPTKFWPPLYNVTDGPFRAPVTTETADRVALQPETLPLFLRMIDSIVNRLQPVASLSGAAVPQPDGLPFPGTESLWRKCGTSLTEAATKLLQALPQAGRKNTVMAARLHEDTVGGLVRTMTRVGWIEEDASGLRPTDVGLQFLRAHRHPKVMASKT